MAYSPNQDPVPDAPRAPDTMTPQERTGPDGDPGHPGDLTPEEEAIAQRHLDQKET